MTVTGDRGGGPFRSIDVGDINSGFLAKSLPQLQAVQAALGFMASEGSITKVTAVSAMMANPATVGLAVINAGLEAAVRTLAVELARVRINAVSPVAIDSSFWTRVPPQRRNAADYAKRAPAGRIGTAAQVAHAVRFLLEATFVTGTILPVDGGFRRS